MWPHSQQLPAGLLAFTLDLWALTTSPRPEGQDCKISAWRPLPQRFLESSWFTLCSFLSGGEGVLRVLSLSPLSGAPGPAILVSCPTPPTGARLTPSRPLHPLPSVLVASGFFLPDHHLSGTWGKSRVFHLNRLDPKFWVQGGLFVDFGGKKF